VLVAHVLVEEAREEERAGHDAAERVGGDGSEVEDLPRRVDGGRGLRGDDAEVAVDGHSLNNAVLSLHGRSRQNARGA
jgi:hypothetical protein